MEANAPLSITIEGQQLGVKRPLFPSRQIDLPGSGRDKSGRELTLRHLLSQIVTIEVDSFRERQARQQLFRVLSAEQSEAGKQSGRIDPAAKTHHQTVHTDQAIGTALQAFEDGLFFVFIDGDQKEALDETIQLAAGSTIKFIRLVALAGG